MRRQSGPSEMQPDPWEPDASTVDDVSGFVDHLYEKRLDRDTGETFIVCRVCGMEHSHRPQCFVPLMERFRDGDETGFTIHLTGEQGHRLSHCLDVAIARFAEHARVLRDPSVEAPLRDAETFAASYDRYAQEAREIRAKVQG